MSEGPGGLLFLGIALAIVGAMIVHLQQPRDPAIRDAALQARCNDVLTHRGYLKHCEMRRLEPASWVKRQAFGSNTIEGQDP
jgi:hypothetical protein